MSPALEQRPLYRAGGQVTSSEQNGVSEKNTSIFNPDIVTVNLENNLFN